VDAGLLSPCDGYTLFGRDTGYATAGYALRFFYDNFGTLQQLTRIDVAVPIGRRERTCLGDRSIAGPPVALYVSFVPPF
jgi:hypothetical protein